MLDVRFVIHPSMKAAQPPDEQSARTPPGPASPARARPQRASPEWPGKTCLQSQCKGRRSPSTSPSCPMGGEKTREQVARRHGARERHRENAHHPPAFVIFHQRLNQRVARRHHQHPAHARQRQAAQRQRQPARPRETNQPRAIRRAAERDDLAQPANCRARAEIQRPAQGANARSRHQPAECARIAEKHIPRVDGREHRVRKSNRADGRHQRDQHLDGHEAKRITKPLPQFDPRMLPHRALRTAGQAHREQRGDDRHVRDSIHQITQARPESGDDEPGDGRPDQPREIKQRRVQRDGIAQMLLALDEFHNQRLPGGHVHRVDDALHQAQDDQMRSADRTVSAQRPRARRIGAWNKPACPPGAGAG